MTDQNDDAIVGVTMVDGVEWLVPLPATAYALPGRTLLDELVYRMAELGTWPTTTQGVRLNPAQVVAVRMVTR